jgi:hypothetical protein
MPSPASRGRLALVAAVLAVSAACAVKLYEPPAGPGQPFAEAATVWSDVTARCATANRFVAEIEVSGWMGEPRERLPTFPVHGALTRDDDIYLEVPAPGKPYLQMAGRSGQAVFLLPREDRVMRAASRDIVHRLTGLRWGARDLLNVLTGCVTTPSGPITGTSYGTQASIELGGGARAYVQQKAGRWELVAGDRDGLRIEYREYSPAFPSLVRVSSISPDVTPLSLTFKVEQHQVNTEIEARIFTLEVPPTFLPMKLEELRTTRAIKEGKN